MFNNIYKATTLNKLLVIKQACLNFIILFFLCSPLLSVQAQQNLNKGAIIDKSNKANMQSKAKIDTKNKNALNKTYINENKNKHLVKKTVKKNTTEANNVLEKNITNGWGDWASNGLEPTKNKIMNQESSLSKEFGVGVQGSIELEINILDKSNLLDDYSGVQAIKIKDISKDKSRKKGKE